MTGNRVEPNIVKGKIMTGEKMIRKIVARNGLKTCTVTRKIVNPRIGTRKIVNPKIGKRKIGTQKTMTWKTL